MKSAGLKFFVIMLVGFFGVMAQGRAQEWVRLDPLEWEVISTFDGSREKVGEDVTAYDIETETGVRLRQSGYSLDPGIANFSFGAYPIFSQGRFRSSEPGRDEDRDILFLNFDARVGLLEEAVTPVSFNGRASRNTGSLGTSLGSRSDFTTENRYVGLNWKNRYFPTTLSYSENLIEQEFRSGLTAALTERDDALQTVTLRGRSSKMDLEIDHAWFTDNVDEDRNFTEDRALLSNFFRWGKGSRLNSRIDYLDRRGFLAFERLAISEDARIQHTRTLSTSYLYRFQAVEVETESTSHAGIFGLRHQLYQNLGTDLTIQVSHDDFSNGSEREYRPRLDFSYQKKIFWGGRFSADLGGGYGLVDRQSAGGLLDVRQESQSVDSSLLVLLVQRFIDPATIVATDATGAIPLTEGTDYELIPVADNRTQLRILSSSPLFPAVIGPGNTILVSYEYEDLPSVKFSVIPFRYGANLDFGWIRLYHRTSGEDQNLISGDDESALTETKQSATGVEFKWSPGAGEATVGAEKRFFRSGDLETDTIAFTQSAFYPVLPSARLSFTATENFIETDITDTDLYTADLSLDWRPLRKLTITPRVGVWIREETREAGQLTEERFLTGSLDVEWSFYKVDVRARYTHDQRRGTITPRDEDRLVLTVVRRSK